MGYHRKKFYTGLLAFVAIACALGSSAHASNVFQPIARTSQYILTGNLTVRKTQVFKDLVYGNLSDSEKLDLYLPNSTGPFPLVIYVHGGGFLSLNADKDYPFEQGIVDKLLANGYAVASLNYRLSSEATFPGAIQDVKGAVRWLRAHAQEYQLNPDRFGAWGNSVGGYLVSMLGTSCPTGLPLQVHTGIISNIKIDLEGRALGNNHQSSCVQAVVDYFGPTDFLQMDQEYADSGSSCPQTHNDADSPESLFIGGPIQRNADLVELANPITYISGDEPPFLIQHGTADCTVPPQQSQLLYDALHSGTAELNYLQDAKHSDPLFYAESNLDTAIAFLDAQLK